MILEEVNIPYPRCPKCNKFVLQQALNGWYHSIDLCHQVEERKCHQLAEDEARAGAATVLTAYGLPINPVSFFKYIGIILSSLDDYWPVVVRNLRRARKRWARLMWLLERYGVDAQTSDLLYVAIVQAVMLYGLDTWVVYPRIGRTLGGFHHKMARILTGKQPQR